MTFSAALDGKHQKQKDQRYADAHQGEQPEGSDKEEDRESGRERHSRDNEDARDNDPERHLPDGRLLFLGRAGRRVVVVQPYSPGARTTANHSKGGTCRATTDPGRMLIVAKQCLRDYGSWSGWADSNRRPPGPKPGALA